MRFLSRSHYLIVLGLLTLFVVGSVAGQDLNQQKQVLIQKIRDIDKQLADSPSPQEYEDLMNQRNKVEAEIKGVTAKLMADVEAMKKINAVKKAYNAGNNAYKLGSYQEAVTNYDRAISLDSTFYKAHYGKGLSLKKLRKYKEAAKAHQGAIGQNPSYVNSYVALGKLYVKMGQEDKAIQNYDSAIQNNPGAAKAYYELGAVYLNYKKDYTKAAQNLTKATQLDGEYDLAHYSLGVSLTELGRLGDALLTLDKALEVTKRKKWHLPHWRKAVVYNKQGNHTLARVEAEEALKQKKDYAPAAYEAGKASKELGALDQAIAYFNVAKKNRTWRTTAEYEIDLIVNRDKYGGK